MGTIERTMPNDDTTETPGVERAMFRHRLATARQGVTPIRRENVDRLIVICQRKQLRWHVRILDEARAEITWRHGD